MSYLRPALILLLLLTLLTGVAYPLLTTGIAQLLFPHQASGSLITEQHKVVGSSLIGQHFSRSDYFWSRPSTTSDTPYNPLSSGGSNLALNNPTLQQQLEQRSNLLKQSHSGNSSPLPVDLLTASGSGLDPHISVAAAYYQSGRIAAARHLSDEQLQILIQTHTQTPLFSFLGPPVVNVLKLNLALDELSTSYGRR